MNTPLTRSSVVFTQLAGAAILGIGIWTEIDPGQFDAFLGNSGYALPAKILMAAGAFVMVVGFLGCYGAIKESRPLLGAVCSYPWEGGGYSVIWAI